jgi:hypothetical protein
MDEVDGFDAEATYGELTMELPAEPRGEGEKPGLWNPG